MKNLCFLICIARENLLFGMLFSDGERQKKEGQIYGIIIEYLKKFMNYPKYMQKGWEWKLYKKFPI